MDDGARTKDLIDAFIRYLDASGHALSQARDLPDDVARAYDLDSGDARFLALAEARDKARSIRASLKWARKQAVKDDGRARADLEFVSDASPWIGQERLTQAQHAAGDTQKEYSRLATAGTQLRGIIRSLNRDLAHEASIARTHHTTWTTDTAHRLLELGFRLAIEPPSERRRKHWMALDDLANEPHPRRAQLSYATRALLRELGSAANPTV